MGSSRSEVLAYLTRQTHACSQHEPLCDTHPCPMRIHLLETASFQYTRWPSSAAVAAGRTQLGWQQQPHAPPQTAAWPGPAQYSPAIRCSRRPSATTADPDPAAAYTMVARLVLRKHIAHTIWPCHLRLVSTTYSATYQLARSADARPLQAL